MSLPAGAKYRGMAVMLLGAVIVMSGGLILPPDGNANPRQGMYSHHRGGKPDFVGHALHRLLREQKNLNLSDEQVGKIRTIAMDYTKTRIRGKADVKLAEVDVRTLAHDEKADLSAIETALKKSESAKTALRVEGVKALRTAFAVLTPGQREKWRAGRMERHGDRHPARHGQGAQSENDSDEPRAVFDNLPEQKG